jgi:solute carrier family 35 protein
MVGILNGQDAPLLEGQIKERGAFFKKIGSAVFYGVASFMITVVNKTILTTYS